MTFRSARLQLAVALVSGCVVALAIAGVASASTITSQIVSSGTTTIPAASIAADAGTGPEVDGLDQDTDGADVSSLTIATTSGGTGPHGQVAQRAKSNPELLSSWLGVNFFDQRFSNNGNQLSVEPPDQALCAGNGYVVESVNDVLRVFDTNGTTLRGPVDLNTFYGYAPAIDRRPGHGNARGPSITDPICYYDAPTKTFFHVVLTLDKVGTSSANAGTNHLDIAVTQNPLGSWTIYKIPVQNDGTNGTPNDHCAGGPCLGDYPHIGADANGIFLTTNEFPFFARGFHSAQIYALPKAALAAGTFSTSVTRLDTLDQGPDGDGFTVWPATSPGDQYASDANGTEYFLSSRAVFSDSDTSNSILTWALTNTASLNTPTPDLHLSIANTAVDEYGVPGRVTQKDGDTPLRSCLADTTTNCWRFVAGAAAPQDNSLGLLNGNDSRFTGVMYANGKLWGTLGTATDQPGVVGAAWYILKPSVDATGQVSDALANSGTLVPGTGDSVTYSTVGVTRSGRGVLAFTLAGPNTYPSAAYAPIDAVAGVGDIHVYGAGVGPQDGFTEYPPFGGSRPRWGDYGAASVDGNTVYVASEYIAQTCTYAQYLTSPIGRCGNTRGALGNWATRVGKIDASH